MGRASQKFDRQLFTLKLSELSRQMQIKSVASDSKARVASRERGNSLLMHMVGGQLALLRDEWLTGVDRIAREVWQTQGEAMTPGFVRDVLVPEAMTLIEVRDGVIKSSVARSQLAHLEDPYPAQHHLAKEIRKLTGEVADRYEIEARELEYQKAPATEGGPQTQLDEQGSIRGLVEDATRDTTLWLQADPSGEERAPVLAIQERLAALARIIERRMDRRGLPEDDRQWSETAADVLSLLDKAREVRGHIVGKGLGRLADHLPQELPGRRPRPKLPEPIRPVNTARTVTQAPAPPMETSGGGYFSSAPKPTRMPSRPDDFPSDLWPRAVVILSTLIEKFPNQKRLRELCEHAVSEMTGLYCEAVETGKMKAGAVVSDGSGMEELLRLLLAANDPGHSSWGISNQAWEILQGVKTARWGKLAQAIAEVQQRTTNQTKPVLSTSPNVQSTGVIPGKFAGVEPWRLTERHEHNVRSWLVEHAIAPTPEVLASFGLGGRPKSPDPVLDSFGRSDTVVASEPPLTQNNGKPAQAAESKRPNENEDAKSRIGRNIERLKTECGWSYEQLADATGIDKKLVLCHTHRKHKPNPKTLREYAQAFSKELNRPVTANNLEE
jgi:hypothetical protein